MKTSKVFEIATGRKAEDFRLISPEKQKDLLRQAAHDRQVIERKQGQAMLNIPVLDTLAKRVDEMRLSNLLTNDTPAISKFDAWQASKSTRNAQKTRDPELSGFVANLEESWRRDPGGSFTVGQLTEYRETYRKLRANSSIVSLINEVFPKWGFNTLDVRALSKLASEIENQNDFDIMIQRAGLDGNSPEQIRARMFILDQLNRKAQGVVPAELVNEQQPARMPEIDAKDPAMVMDQSTESEGTQRSSTEASRRKAQRGETESPSWEDQTISEPVTLEEQSMAGWSIQEIANSQGMSEGEVIMELEKFGSRNAQMMVPPSPAPPQAPAPAPMPTMPPSPMPMGPAPTAEKDDDAEDKEKEAKYKILGPVNSTLGIVAYRVQLADGTMTIMPASKIAQDVLDPEVNEQQPPAVPENAVPADVIVGPDSEDNPAVDLVPDAPIDPQPQHDQSLVDLSPHMAGLVEEAKYAMKKGNLGIELAAQKAIETVFPSSSQHIKERYWDTVVKVLAQYDSLGRLIDRDTVELEPGEVIETQKNPLDQSGVSFADTDLWGDTSSGPEMAPAPETAVEPSSKLAKKAQTSNIFEAYDDLEATGAFNSISPAMPFEELKALISREAQDYYGVQPAMPWLNDLTRMVMEEAASGKLAKKAQLQDWEVASIILYLHEDGGKSAEEIAAILGADIQFIWHEINALMDARPDDQVLVDSTKERGHALYTQMYSAPALQAQKDLSEVQGTLSNLLQSDIQNLDQYDKQGLLDLLAGKLEEAGIHVGEATAQKMMSIAKSLDENKLMQYIVNIALKGSGLGVTNISAQFEQIPVANEIFQDALDSATPNPSVVKPQAEEDERDSCRIKDSFMHREPARILDQHMGENLDERLIKRLAHLTDKPQGKSRRSIQAAMAGRIAKDVDEDEGLEPIRDEDEDEEKEATFRPFDRRRAQMFGPPDGDELQGLIEGGASVEEISEKLGISIEEAQAEVDGYTEMALSYFANYRRANSPPAKGDMNSLQHSKGKREGERWVLTVGWNPDQFEGMSEGNIFAQVKSYVLQEASDVEDKDWGFIGDVQLDKVDLEKGEATVSFKSSAIDNAVPTQISTLEKELASPGGDQPKSEPGRV